MHKLLEKLQPDMITLDPTFIGNVDRAPAEVGLPQRGILLLTWFLHHACEGSRLRSRSPNPIVDTKP